MDAVSAILKAVAEREAAGKKTAQPTGSNHRKGAGLDPDYYGRERTRQRKRFVTLYGNARGGQTKDQIMDRIDDRDRS